MQHIGLDCYCEVLLGSVVLLPENILISIFILPYIVCCLFGSIWKIWGCLINTILSIISVVVWRWSQAWASAPDDSHSEKNSKDNTSNGD